LPEDFRWFRELTTGHIVVMGRRTFESIGRALPGRQTLVLSRNEFRHPDVRTIRELAEVDPSQVAEEVFICGGAEVYRLALPYCSDLYLTRVHRVVEGDVFFPPFEASFELVGKVRERPEFDVLHYRNRQLMRPEAKRPDKLR
jgi:dihydrofolate reductase